MMIPITMLIDMITMSMKMMIINYMKEINVGT